MKVTAEEAERHPHRRPNSVSRLLPTYPGGRQVVTCVSHQASDEMPELVRAMFEATVELNR